MFGASRIEKRVKELEDTCLRLTRIVESHDLEWDDMRARCKRLLDRTEKAAKRLEPQVESEAPQDDPQNGEGVSPAMTLSPSQHRLQQQILQRRRSKVQ